VDVRLAEEQQMLQGVAASIASTLAPLSVDAIASDRVSGGAAAWSTLVDAGLVGVHLPDPVPGSTGSTGPTGPHGSGHVVEAALVAEHLAAELVPAPFVGAGVWAPALLAEAGAAEVLEEVVTGARRLSPVLTADLRRMARPGEEGVAFDASGADAGLVVDEAGFLRTVKLGKPTDGADLTRLLRVVPIGTPAGEPIGAAIGDAGLTRVTATALVVLAADLLGVAQGALDASVSYVRDRMQFGVPVGSFQAVQHLAAHAAMLVEAARSSVWYSAWAVDELDSPEALLAARQAKAFAASAARDVGEIAIQMFGGIGMTWEHFSHVRQRRILLTRCVLGDESAQHAVIATELLAAGPG
jgi:alkylation response protein AidB-like acyl-CoA dehydrogenase